MTSFAMTAIGTVHSGFGDKFSAPRQPFVADEAPGRIELLPGHNFEDALCDLETFTHVWVLFVFDRNATWHPKVMPPMGSEVRRGVFATRSPHRPNPIGMSALRLVGVDGLTVRVTGLDILDGTPVLDLKPYVPMADQIEAAGRGWVGVTSPDVPRYDVAFSPLADEQLQWWQVEAGEDLRTRIHEALVRGPKPHAFRRIRKGLAGALILGLPSWRIEFVVDGQSILVRTVRSAHKPAHFANDPSLFRHQQYVQRFGA